MKSILFFLLAFVLPFCSCSIFKNNEEYYPYEYQEYYNIPFPYLHNYSNNLELKIISFNDTIAYGDPLKINIELVNKSKTDTMYYGYFNSRYDFNLLNSDGKEFERFANKYISGDVVETPRDQYGRPFTSLFHSNRILYPGDSIKIYNEDFSYPEYNNDIFPDGEYYLTCKLHHLEFDSLFNPVETVINSDSIKFVISEPTKNKQ